MIDKLNISLELKLAKITFADLVFEERVLLNCFYCPKYNVNRTCPPKIPNFDYKKIFSNMKIC